MVNKAFYSLLHSVSVNDKGLKPFELVLMDSFGSNAKELEREVAKLRTELSRIQKRLIHIQTLIAAKKLELADYRKNEREACAENWTVEVGANKPERRTRRQKAGNDRLRLHFLRNLPKLFTSADLEEKHRLLGSTFPQKIVFENSKGRTNEGDNILMLLAKGKSELWPKKGKAPDNSGALSQVVNPLGLTKLYNGEKENAGRACSSAT